MSRLILFNMMTLDGYFEDVNRDISWHNVDGAFNEFAAEQLNSASLLVFGRITYQLMAGYWPTPDAVNDDPVIAGLMNSIPKVVFSRSLSKPGWNNTRLSGEDPVKECMRLRETNEKDIFIFGSADLADLLRDKGIIDEFRIMVSPVLLGNGNPLFKLSGKRLDLKLIKSMTFSSGNVLLCYEPLRK